jgi:hypothetical protein
VQETYASAHVNVRKVRDVARWYDCIDCGEKAEQWAFQGSENALIDKINGLAFSMDPMDYAPMCRPCHRALDKRTRGVPVPEIPTAPMDLRHLTRTGR